MTDSLTIQGASVNVVRDGEEFTFYLEAKMPPDASDASKAEVRDWLTTCAQQIAAEMMAHA